MTSVFLSYRHESDAHREHVRALAERLRSAGLDVIFDGFEEAKNHGMAPAQGWPLWSIQQANCEHVLIIASSGWFRIFNRHEPAPKSGLGAAAEAECIFQRMYVAGGNTFAVMTYFDRDADLIDLPPYLAKCTRLDALKDETIQRIVRWVTGAAAMPAPDASAPGITWPQHVTIPPRELADRHAPCDFFRQMLTGAVEESIACFIAESGAGKSKLLDVFHTAALDALASGDRVAYLRNLHEQLTVDMFIDTLCHALGGHPSFPRYEQSIIEDKSPEARRLLFLKDLLARSAPALIILDTWNKATDELRDWVTKHLLTHVLRAPAVKLILAGQATVPYPAAKPREVRCFDLQPIELHEWEHFIDVRYPGEAATLKPTITLLLSRASTPAQGVKTIAHILELLDQGGAAA